MFGKVEIYYGFDREEYMRRKKILDDAGISYTHHERSSHHQAAGCCGVNAYHLEEIKEQTNPDILYELSISKKDREKLKGKDIFS